MDTTPSTGSRVIEGRLDGTVFATSSAQTVGTQSDIFVGANGLSEAQTTGEWWFDDLALNDNTGSHQNGYPGSGKILQLRPNGTGDVNQYASATGGTAGAANNYTRVDEVTPDGGTTFNQATAVNQQDLFTVTSSGIGASDTVNVVMVGLDLANSTTGASTTTAVTPQLEKTSGGTIASGTPIIPDSTSFGVNGPSSPRNYPLVTYNDPDGNPWTLSTLTSMQIGYEETAFATSHSRVSTVWASVDYTPVTNTAPNAPTLSSPSNGGTVSTTTPTLDFTTTDPNSDNVSYEVQVDSSSSFNSNTGVVASVPTSDWSSNVTSLSSATNTIVSQSFTGNGSSISSSQFYLSISGSPTGNAVSKIYNMSGTYGSTGQPTGTALATSGTLDVTTLTGSMALITFNFTGANQITLANGSHYCVTVEYSGGDASDVVLVGYDLTDVYSGNYAIFSVSSVWTDRSYDAIFAVNGVSPLIDALSASGGHDAADFTDVTNGSDTDPFASGDSISYIVPGGEALTNGSQYYWRARAIDPSGSDTWSSWSTTDSFTVSTGGGSPSTTDFFMFM